MVEKSKIIEKYLIKYYKNTRSRKTTAVYLKKFFRTMDTSPGEILKLSKDEIEGFLFDYAIKIEDAPKKTQVICFSAIKKFLDRNKVYVDVNIWEDIRGRNSLIKNVYSIAKKATPTQTDLKKLLSYCTGVKSRALFTFLATTGLRIREALQITFNNLDMEKRMVTLVEEGKNEYPRFTFFTPEAKEQLELWLPERERMLQRRYKTSKFVREQLTKRGYEVKKQNISHSKPNYVWKIYKNGRELTKKEIINMEDRVFPFDYVTADVMWTRLLEKAGEPYNKKDRNPKLKHPRHLYNIHCLRRFWLTQLMFERANKEYVDYMSGHWSNLDATYKSQNPRLETEMKKEYDQHMKGLLIFETQPDLTEINESLDEKDKEIKELQKQITKQNGQIQDLSVAFQLVTVKLVKKEKD